MKVESYILGLSLVAACVAIAFPDEFITFMVFASLFVVFCIVFFVVFTGGGVG